jgi:hypothetical protein
VTTLPSIFPFSKLELRKGEVLRWVGYNPTFHRFRSYGLAVSNAAFYVCGPAWIFAKWSRYALSEIADVALVDTGREIGIKFRVGDKKVVVRAPFDSHADDSQFDRQLFSNAIGYLQVEGDPHCARSPR